MSLLVVLYQNIQDAWEVTMFLSLFQAINHREGPEDTGGSMRMGRTPVSEEWEQDVEGWMDRSWRIHTAQSKGREESVGGHWYSGPLPWEKAEKKPWHIHLVQDFWPQWNRSPLKIHEMSIYQQRYLYLSGENLWMKQLLFYREDPKLSRELAKVSHPGFGLIWTPVLALSLLTVAL